MATDTNKPAGHPAPLEHRVSSTAMLFAVFAAPAAWLMQLIVNYGLAAHRCFPHDEPLVAGLSGSTQAALIAVNLAAITVAFAGGLLARRIWHRTRDEHEGSTHRLLEAGEGRTRFLAMFGQLAGLGFLIATIFDTVALYMVPQCFG
jgi:hypothetical protein